MSFDTVRFFDGTGEQPSTIVGGSPDASAVLTSCRFIAQLANLGINAEVVADTSVPPPKYSLESDAARRVEFPTAAIELDAFGRRRIGRTAIEIIPPLDESTMQAFVDALNRATGPIRRDHRSGHEGSLTRVTTEELRVLVLDGAASVPTAN